MFIANAPSPPSGGSFPTAEEIRAHIPPEGTTVANLLKTFAGRINNNKEFIKLMQGVAVLNKETKRLILR